VYYNRHREYPLFLIDDVDAELDRKRLNSLLEYLDGRTQTFITTSKESLVEQFIERAGVYLIKNGAVQTKTTVVEPVSSHAEVAESI
jgi:DNA replication and repair protein RecF